MKKLFLISLLLSQIFFSSQTFLFAQNFAPLNLGNIWVWENEWGELVKSTLVDTNYFINNNYYSRIRYKDNTDMFDYSRLEEQDSLFYKYQTILPYNNGDLPYYKLNCVLGDTFSYPIFQVANTTIAVVDVYQAPVFDTILTVKILHFNRGGLVESYQAWTDEIGLLGVRDIPWGNIYFTIKGCAINGKVYGDTTTTVEVEDEPYKYFNFKLYQNYPNPFNPTTTIEYELQEYGFVNLRVYDLLGNEIAVLVNEEKYPGRYSIKFFGSNLSSGVYFYKLIIGGNTQVRKMILLR